jgi:methionyl-tRNA synthetase
VPVSGWEDKRLYVWFEAVIGYLSAAIEWASLSGDPERWKDWWYNPDSRAYYFIGKDNIPFHAVIWPAQLAGAGRTFGAFFDEDDKRELVLPYDVPANEFLNMEGKKISGSRNWVVDALDFLSRYDPDPLRYYLTANMPETRDTDWEWSEFVTRNNNELVATWGNLVNRVLSFAHKNWEGRVPDPGELRPEDEAITREIEEGFDRVADLYDKVKLRGALTETMRLAGVVNKYLDDKAPWFEIKEDKELAGKTIYTAIRAIDSLKTLFAPVLPFTCQQLHQTLGYETPIFGEQYTEEIMDNLSTHTVLRYRAGETCCSWQPSEIQAGREYHKPKPLFKKLEPEIAEQELERLG